MLKSVVLRQDELFLASVADEEALNCPVSWWSPSRQGASGETGLTTSRRKSMKKLIAAALVALALAVPATSASAAASACGAVHGAFANENGNFGWLGAEGGTPGYHNGAVGQDPGATGFNNSHTDCQA
jgi:hypothetical protein